MKQLITFIAAILIFSTSFAQSQTHVSGYYRSNGTYVQPHYRTSPNYTRNDNWSTVGNTNPYTGAAGTKPGDYNSSYNSYRTTDYSPSRSSYNSYPSSTYPTYTPSTYTNYSTPSYSTPYYSSGCNCYISR
jgi:hypothetical protein